METDRVLERRGHATLREFLYKSRAWIFYVCIMAAFTLFGVTYSDIRASRRTQNLAVTLAGIQGQLQVLQDNSVNDKVISERIEALELSISNLEAAVDRMSGTIEAKGK